jgi:glyoxylase-like metal-dependent hydrolase (beta-lactamase superfamily II)
MTGSNSSKILSRTSRSRGAGSPAVKGFYDGPTGSIQYVAWDPATSKAVIIDCVQGFDPKSYATDFTAAGHVLDFIEEQQLEVEWILDTHPHADHFMASSYLRGKLGAPNAIGDKVVEIAALWRELYNLPLAFEPERDFDRLFSDGETFALGSLDCRVMLSPGHTLGSVTYLIGTDAAFVNDTFMQPDAGTSRCDFPGGSAATLYDSLQAILSLPGETRLFVGHDYGTDKREEPQWESTVEEQAASNKHVGGGTPKHEYARLREERDATLALPDRMLAALQVNLRAGKLPPAEADGHSYLKMPMNRF